MDTNKTFLWALVIVSILFLAMNALIGLAEYKTEVKRAEIWRDAVIQCDPLIIPRFPE